MSAEINNIIFSNNLDGYILPKNDNYFTEYSKLNNLKSITKFSGSAGFAIFLKKKNIYLLTVDILFKQKKRQEKILKFAKFHMCGLKIF